MKVSLNWLQNYFDEALPKAEEIDGALTFHAFEIDEREGDMLDVKVLPNRAADCLSHRGIAKELSAIFDTPMKSDPLREALPEYASTNELSVAIEDPRKCSRYMGALVKGVKVAPSPAWLKEALESVGQRSINNVVDATNYVMLNIGQPLHAFDAAKLSREGSKIQIGVRAAKEGEKITTLSGDELTLSSSIQVITDAGSDTPIALAGIKGGNAAELTEATTDIVVESANFDGTTTRRAAQKLKLFTDASSRFQNRPSAELAAYGMRDVLALIKEIAGGEVVGVVDEYKTRPETKSVSVTHARITDVLGVEFSVAEIEEVFRRLGLETRAENGTFTVLPPFERTDLTIPEDLIEEVGRILGYDRVPATVLLPVEGKPDQARFRGIEKIKDELIAQGFIEVSTQSFAKKGDITLANPLDKSKPALRTSLDENMKEAGEQARHYAPRVLAYGQKPKLFEIGTVFTKEGEHIVAKASEPTTASLRIIETPEYVPTQYELSAFKPFSAYPFIVRDIALWVPSSVDAASLEAMLRGQAGELLVRLDQFDRFEKEGRVSYAFRLVFESNERTLTDEEVNAIMERIYASAREAGYEVR